MLQMHVVVTQPTTLGGTGSISCRPVGMEPIKFHWNPPVETDETGSEATAVPVGRYTIRAVDANDAFVEVCVDVNAQYQKVAVVREYRVQNATTGTSRDGRVEAMGVGLDAVGLRFHWSNGVETEQPILADVPCGRYVVTCTSDDETFSYIHETSIAVVSVRV
tara:strand:+ start:5536 stop:6024 length:489 start_codon:yes stop_codon:yes gene_type:complete